MSMTAQDRKYMELRETLTNAETEVIDRLFGELYEAANENNVKAAGDDRAASLEAALVRFFLESREQP